MKTATADQIKKFHTLLSKAGIMHRKRDIVLGASRGRTESSRDLSVDEMKAVIDSIETDKPEVKRPPVNADPVLDKKRKRVIANLASAGYILASGKPDMDAIYSWTRKQKHKKELNKLNSRELSELIVASEGVAKHFMKQS